MLADIQYGELPGRGGALQAAINLELGPDRISRMNIKVEGLNGQLPNLDLVNTAVKLSRKERIPTALHKRVSGATAQGAYSNCFL